jgi:hypothetical protein
MEWKKEILQFTYIGGLLIVYPSSGSLAAMVASHGTRTSKF